MVVQKLKFRLVAFRCLKFRLSNSNSETLLKYTANRVSKHRAFINLFFIADAPMQPIAKSLALYKVSTEYDRVRNESVCSVGSAQC